MLLLAKSTMSNQLHKLHNVQRKVTSRLLILYWERKITGTYPTYALPGRTDTHAELGTLKKKKKNIRIITPLMSSDPPEFLRGNN